mmetsp:Transcript_7030/g.13253  ORF Transcript_7030/g.13253 Transcript_7030/m.13253 type:complete len:467 (-) Transcript_7030:137-1537(-)
MWILRLQQHMLLLLPLHLLFLVSPTHVNAMNNSLSLLLFYKVSMRNVPQQKSKVYYLLQMKRCCSTTGTATSGSRGGISSSGSGSGSGSGSFITSSFSSAFLTTAGSFGRTAGGAKCTTRFSRHGILKPSYYQNSHRFTRFYMSTSNISSSSSNGSISGTNPDTIQLATSLQLPSYWERLGNPRTVMAPMVAQSDLAFRKLCRAYGTELCFTQMIHAHNFVSSNSFQWNHLDVYPWGKRIYVSPSGVRALKGCSSSSSSSSVRIGGGQLDGLALGIAGDKSPNLLWRLQNGELPEMLTAKVFWVLIGTNDFLKPVAVAVAEEGGQNVVAVDQCSEEVVFMGIRRVVEEIMIRKPKSMIVVNGLLPRSDIGGRLYKEGEKTVMDAIDIVNHRLKDYCNGQSNNLEYFQASDIFIDTNASLGEEKYGKYIPTDRMNDFIHPTPLGYKLWAEKIREKVKSLTDETLAVL